MRATTDDLDDGWSAPVMPRPAPPPTRGLVSPPARAKPVEARRRPRKSAEQRAEKRAARELEKSAKRAAKREIAERQVANRAALNAAARAKTRAAVKPPTPAPAPARSAPAASVPATRDVRRVKAADVARPRAAKPAPMTTKQTLAIVAAIVLLAALLVWAARR